MFIYLCPKCGKKLLATEEQLICSNCGSEMNQVEPKDFREKMWVRISGHFLNYFNSELNLRRSSEICRNEFYDKRNILVRKKISNFLSSTTSKDAFKSGLGEYFSDYKRYLVSNSAVYKSSFTNYINNLSKKYTIINDFLFQIKFPFSRIFVKYKTLYFNVKIVKDDELTKWSVLLLEKIKEFEEFIYDYEKRQFFFEPCFQKEVSKLSGKSIKFVKKQDFFEKAEEMIDDLDSTKTKYLSHRMFTATKKDVEKLYNILFKAIKLLDKATLFDLKTSITDEYNNYYSPNMINTDIYNLFVEKDNYIYLC